MDRRCVVTGNRWAADGIVDMTFSCPDMAAMAVPGQFVHIRCGGSTLLRRPISICDVQNGEIRIVFAVVGEGTRLLAELQPGDRVDVLGPLGHGYELKPPHTSVVFAGGGLGVPPLLFAAKRYGAKATVLLGFQTMGKIILENDFAAAGCSVEVATDDGTYGHKGFVTELLERSIRREHPAEVYACGPKPMLRATAAVAKSFGVPCQVSMEERMACGIGACLGCACKTRKDGRESYSHVCKDGPVFRAEEVFFGE